MSASSNNMPFNFVLPAEPIVPQVTAPGQQISLAQAMELATQLHAQDRLQEAEYWLQKIVQIESTHPFALHLLGVIAHQSGQPRRAIELIRHAIQSNDGIGLFHANLGEMYRQSGLLSQAIEHGERAVSLSPDLLSAHGNLGIAYFDACDYERAETCQRAALSLDHGFAPALNNMGSIARARNQMTDAIGWYRKAIVAKPDYLQSLSNLGAVLLEEERAQEAIEPLAKALRIKPDYAEALCNLGLVNNALGHQTAAFDLLRKAVQIRPDYSDAHVGLAQMFLDAENLTDAEKSALRAIEFAPYKPNGFSTLGNIYAELARGADAETMYLRALKIDPGYIDAMLGLGQLCTENGDTEKAEALFRQALALKHDNLAARLRLAQLKKIKPGDEDFAALIAVEEAAQSGATPLQEKIAMSLHFTLGKGFDDLGEYAKAFPHFLAGCNLKRATSDYDPEATANTFEDVMRIFDRNTIDRLRGVNGNTGNSSRLPIFVLGMPRSGTTLTEQIIASHPDVYGAGELYDLMVIAQRDRAGNRISFADNLRALDQEGLTAWGADYVKGLQQRAPGARHITDKMPANFFAIGLIHLMLPNARIIHVNRDPVDTCLSCFTRLFNRKQDHTYDLAELGRYYVGYARLMAHWRSVLPAGAFLDINYEDIVADQEAQARRLLAYCNLDWNDACLDFHKLQRTVRTASVTQVRQPIYKSSVQRWRAYETFLGPLLNALGDLAADTGALTHDQ